MSFNVEPFWTDYGFVNQRKIAQDANTFFSISRNMETNCPPSWNTDSLCKLESSQGINVNLSVNNVLKETRILNIFGVIKGFEEPGTDPALYFS